MGSGGIAWERLPSPSVVTTNEAGPQSVARSMLTHSRHVLEHERRNPSEGCRDAISWAFFMVSNIVTPCTTMQR